MHSKTPQFDAALEEILKDLIPHERTCRDCAAKFELLLGDIELFKLLRVPPPTLCPDCRNRRRLSFANYSNIYKRKCDAPSHDDVMISLVSPIVPWVTYDYETYYSDVWDPFSFGREVDSQKPFFEQYLGFMQKVPQPGVRRGSESPNSDFSFYGKNMKDCYYVFGGRRSEDIMYSSSIYDSKHAVDSYLLHEVDTGFECVTLYDSYHCFHAYFSQNCIECDFIYDCRNCQNCFGCVNLRNKQYCWFNEQLTKEEYQKRRAAVDLGSRSESKKYKDEFWKLVKQTPVLAARIQQSENVSGSDIKFSKNCHGVFQVYGSENIRHAYFAIMNMKDSMDFAFAGKAEKLYDCQNVGSNSSNVKFSYAVKESSDCEYVMTGTNCHDCFGCAGLKNASYCIFNKQYEKEEYFKKVDKIKTEMLQRGEYGEFFPMTFAPYAYNGSLAQIVYPMTEVEAMKRGLLWQPETEANTAGIQTIQVSELPDNISDITDDIYQKAILGERSGKPFRLIPREVEFYKRYKIALPTDTPYQRIIDRYKIMSDFKMHDDVCFKCGKGISSAYMTSEGWKPYCASCYQQDFL